MKAKREDYSEAEAYNQESSNNSDNESFEQVLARRLARRNFLKGAAVSTGMLVINPSALAGRDRDRGDRDRRDRDERPRPLNRRLTAESEYLLTGPAAGHDLLKTSSDPTGRRVRGSLNNCAAGKTPWGTVLTCEENFNQYFANNGRLADGDPRKAIHARYGLTLGASERRWENFHDRFDISKEPNEPFRFGWVIEVDPFDPDSTPRKLTALGRMKHEAATVVISKRGHAVVYTGDDERFDYMYKFVSEKRYRGGSCRDNHGLLDSGVLYVAKFNDDVIGA